MSYEKDEFLVILCLKMQHDLRGSMALLVQRILIKIFAIDVKGGGKETKGFCKPIRGRVLPSMPKGEIVGNIVIDGKGIGKDRSRT